MKFPMTRSFKAAAIIVATIVLPSSTVLAGSGESPKAGSAINGVKSKPAASGRTPSTKGSTATGITNGSNSAVTSSRISGGGPSGGTAATGK